MKIEKYKDFIIERLKLNTDFNKTLSGERTNLSGINNKFYDKIKKMDNSLPSFYDTLKIFTELSSIKDVDGVIKFADNKQIRMIKDLDIPNDINLEDAKSYFIKKYFDDKIINSLKSQGISIDTNSNLDNIIINLKDLISKKVERVLSISLDKIISDNNLNSNNIVYFTHVSLNQNLTIDDIKNQINPQSELRDKLPGTAFDKIKDKWGFYVSIYDEDPKTEYDAFHYISRATEMDNGRKAGIDFDKLHKACIYQLTLKPDSLFIDCENLEFRMVNEISKDVYDSIIEWGFDGVYDKNPYTKGGFEYNSVLEISICNVDSIEKIVKRNDLKLNIIKEILKNDTEKEHFEWLIKDMIKHVDIITKEVFDVICDYYGKDVILNKTKDILENLNDPFSGLGFKAEDVQKIIDLL